MIFAVSSEIKLGWSVFGLYVRKGKFLAGAVRNIALRGETKTSAYAFKRVLYHAPSRFVAGSTAAHTGIAGKTSAAFDSDADHCNDCTGARCPAPLPSITLSAAAVPCARTSWGVGAPTVAVTA